MRTARTILAACLALLLSVAADTPPALPTVSVVAFPSNVEPGQTVYLSVSVHSDTAAATPSIRLGASAALRITDATPYRGTCVASGNEWLCRVPAAPDAPTIIYVTAHVNPMPCTHLARFYAAVNDSPGAAQWLTIEKAACRLYVPFAAQGGH